MKVKELYAILKREPEYWGMELVVEIYDGDTVKSGELVGLTTTLEEPREMILKIAVKTGEDL